MYVGFLFPTWKTKTNCPKINGNGAVHFILFYTKKTRRKILDAISNISLFQILDRQKSRFSDRPIDQTYSNICSSLGKPRILVEKLILDFYRLMPQHIVKIWTNYTHINQISFQFEPIFSRCLLHIKSC